MEFNTICDVNEISATQRAAIEHLLGQPLSGKQKVFIMAFTPGTIADTATRAAARASLARTFTSQADRASKHGITSDEADEAVEEAMQHARPRSE